METKDILLKLRTRMGLSQDALAEKVYVTRQAVSRWENGETTPNTETLKLLSGVFDVSINTLLGSPRQLICQCCGMPLEDAVISREADGQFNEEYCKWCYAGGRFAYTSMDDLIEYCAGHMANENFTAGQVRAYMKDMLPGLNHWKRYAALCGEKELLAFKRQIMDELNALQVEGMPEIDRLDILQGRSINHEYALPNGDGARFLEDDAFYLSAQAECLFGGERHFGVVAGMGFLLVYTCIGNGDQPELVIYKNR